jgi:hypothetical protein
MMPALIERISGVTPMLTPLTRFSLATHDGPYQTWPLTTPLLVDGVPCAQRVPGYFIEGQYQWHDHALLINSWDCPFEESYDFLLLDPQQRIVSRKSLGVPFATMLLQAHWRHDDDAVRLHFSGHLFYTLTIRPPSGFFRRTPSLRLARHLVRPRDEETQRSIRTLNQQLADIRETLERDAAQSPSAGE